MASMTREEAARVLGMKVREVTDWDGQVALLFDGTRFRVHGDGTFEQMRGMQPVAAPAPDVVVEAPPADLSDDVPAGPAADVTAWVGDDQGRAEAALLVERGRDRPRVTLVAELERLVAH